MLKNGVKRNPTTTAHRVVTLICGLLLSCAIAGFGNASAQAPSTLSGTVLDPMNRAIPNVGIVLIDTASKQRKEVRTNEQGEFEIPGLHPGVYQLLIGFPAFKPVNAEIVMSGLDVRRTFALQLGSLMETVSISADDKMKPPPPPPPAPRRVGKAEAPPPPPPPPQRVGGAPVPCEHTAAGGNVRAPRKLRHTSPVYPSHLAAEGIGGEVRLEARIGVDGFVRELKVIESPHPDLTKAASDAVRQWQWDSTLLNCVPVEVTFTVALRFSADKVDLF